MNNCHRRTQAEAELLSQIALAETEVERAVAETARANAEQQARLQVEAKLRKLQEKLR